MKIISLNIWGGIVFEPLLTFINERKATTDIFLFQEMFSTSSDIKVIADNARADIYSQIMIILGDEFQGYNRPIENGRDYKGLVDFDLHYGLAAFVRKTVDILKEDEIQIADASSDYLDFFKPKDELTEHDKVWTTPRNAQYFVIKNNDTTFCLVNLHGLWVPTGEGDNDLRIEQSTRILNLIKDLNVPAVIMGDFNLLPETESLAILTAELENLITTYKIETTRSDFYTKPNKFADYTLISKNIAVKSFEVLQIPVSDHLPMILDID